VGADVEGAGNAGARERAIDDVDCLAIRYPRGALHVAHQVAEPVEVEFAQGVSENVFVDLGRAAFDHRPGDRETDLEVGEAVLTAAGLTVSGARWRHRLGRW